MSFARQGRPSNRQRCVVDPGSILTTINGPVAGWGEIVGDTNVAAAMLDRLQHRSVVLNLDDDSYRLREHHARNQALRDGSTTSRGQPLT